VVWVDVDFVDLTFVESINVTGEFCDYLVVSLDSWVPCHNLVLGFSTLWMEGVLQVVLVVVRPSHELLVTSALV
jgi:hypothetical protein